MRKQTIQVLQCLHVGGMDETCCCLPDKQLLVTMLIYIEKNICHYTPLSRNAETTSNTKHVNQRTCWNKGYTCIRYQHFASSCFFERKTLIENPKQVDPNTKLVDQKQILHSHQQLVPNVVGSSSLLRNNTQQYLITKGPRVICI